MGISPNHFLVDSLPIDIGVLHGHSIIRKCPTSFLDNLPSYTQPKQLFQLSVEQSSRETSFFSANMSFLLEI